MRKSVVEKLKPSAAKFLSSSQNPANVGDVARQLATSWGSARQILMLLWVDGVVECRKTSNGLVCQVVDKDVPRK